VSLIDPEPPGDPGAGPVKRPSTTGAAAAAVVSSRVGGGILSRLPEDVEPRDEAEGYRAQLAAHGLLSRSGYGARAGWKIGCTTRVMQAYLGVDSPCAGGMFLAHLWRGSHTFAIPTTRRLGVEAEIAVRMARDLPGGAAEYGVADVAGAIAACMAAIEVVEDRYADFATLGIPTLIADDFFHYSAVLGSEVEGFDPRRLKDVTAMLMVNGEEKGSGRGADIMGEPLEALRWLANGAVQWGTPLRAGDIVLLGSLVQVHWVTAGGPVVATADVLGEVTATFVGS
jgi:2-keto-4-pentenoate hydratase